MDVLSEIFEWSKTRPVWQRDALRRLVLSGELTDNDIDKLAEICKNGHGLADEQTIIPLDKSHLPADKGNVHKVNLLSIYHQRGVNALADDQQLNFGPSLTAVYGDNATGKSGYTRILKSACRARGVEDILGNVLSGSAPLNPSVSIKYTVGDNPDPQEWSGGHDNEYLARVSVFDSHSATVYLTSRTDVAFRPFGLDLFDKLSKACMSVRNKLDRDKATLGTSLIQSLQLPEGTEPAKLISGLSSLTNPEKVKSLGTLYDNEKGKLKLLEKQLLDLQANDPIKVAKELTLQEGRYRTLHEHLTTLDNLLSADATNNILTAQADVKAKGDIAIELQQASFPEGLLDGTGSEEWSTLWEAARQFSQSKAYPDEEFPFTESDARCLLCQQDLQPDAAARLKQFEAFVKSTGESELRASKDKYLQLFQRLDSLKTVSDITEATIKEIRIDDESLANEVSSALTIAEARRSKVVESLRQLTELPSNLPDYVSVSNRIQKLKEQTHQRIQNLQGQSAQQQKEQITKELTELKARETLGKNEQNVLAEIERMKKLAAYRLCYDETRTQTITTKSTEVTKIVVTEQLKKIFKAELANLEFKHIEVELKEYSGEYGNLYHKLILTRAPGVELPKVVSEGEARCLSIAAFFAELSTADDPSAILFDDPVSSLDYKWRDGVAKRLVNEAKTRQVIVFTHDIVFLLLLHQYTEQQSVNLLDQHIRQITNIGAGICEEELPWVAMKVNKRISHLRKEWQDAEKLHRNGHIQLYERNASLIYGLLREAWERGIEEVLLEGVVERYRNGIQTQRIGRIADISDEDCKIIDIAMTKCSQWLTGHDQAPAARQNMPEPAELKTDIETLENWIKVIRARRK